MICDYCFQLIKKSINSLTRESNHTSIVNFCSLECKDAYNKDLIQDQKYERKMRGMK